jgi:glutathione synthase
MKIAFIVNDVATETAVYTTTSLAWTAHKREHDVYLIGVGDLSYSADEHMTAIGHKVSGHSYKSADTFLKAMKKSPATRISSVDLDVIFLRNDPSIDVSSRGWAQNAPYIFSQIALRDGVIVVNNPEKLSDAINKMYFQHFPKVLRPQTIITRDTKEIEEFFESQKQKMILKPLQGSGGKNVFLVDKKSKMNLSQTIEAISRDGYIVAQEYLPEAVNGDMRLFLMNGVPLVCQGKYAAIRRINKVDDIRSNVSAGGSVRKVQVTDEVLELADVLKPKLIQDGMFLVGVDIVGNKLMEVNVFSPGALSQMTKMYKVDFLAAVIEALETKVRYKAVYGNDIDTYAIATL